MIIDFHTHIFPEKIAPGTIKQLESVASIKASTDGTLNGLKQSMKRAGIDWSVVLPVVTKPKQFGSVNTYAAQITGKDGIVSFGGIHPDSEDYKGELDRIVSLGLKGIKLHPDYQNTFIDDDKYLRIIQYAMDCGLFISIHSGVDVGLPNPVHCTPKRAARMLDILNVENRGDTKIILAHTGGYQCWDRVLRYLVGRNVLLDISFSLGDIEDEMLYHIVNDHGAEKILFATDSPWSDQQAAVDYFTNMNFTSQETELILGKNACRLLEI